MKAVQIVSTGSPLEDRTVPEPVPSATDALVAVEAAGICHSDAHYQDGTSAAGPFPLTPGHEVAGVVISIGSEVETVQPGDRVALHYLVTCGRCRHCLAGDEQFCPSAEMIGKHRSGGYAERIVVPARNLVAVPDGVDIAHAAVAMCSTSTSFHALRRADLRGGETVTVVGAGGLGQSAVQLASICGARRVIAIDTDQERLSLAESFGALTIDATAGDPVDEVHRIEPAGSDVVVDLVGVPTTVRQATKMAAIHGRVAVVGISDLSADIDTYRDLIGREVSLLGVSDHTLEELPIVLDWLSQGRLDLSRIVTETVDLDAGAIDAVLRRRRASGPGFRTVIRPRAQEART